MMVIDCHRNLTVILYKLMYYNFQPFEIVFCYRDPQPQVVENYSYLFNLRPNIYKYWCWDSHIIPSNSDLIG